MFFKSLSEFTKLRRIKRCVRVFRRQRSGGGSSGVAQEIRGATCAGNFTVRACAGGLFSCRNVGRKRMGEKEKGREMEREKGEKKRCWVHDSCKPQGHTSPRLAPPLATLACPFSALSPAVSLYLSPFSATPSISLRARPS